MSLSFDIVINTVLSLTALTFNVLYIDSYGYLSKSGTVSALFEVGLNTFIKNFTSLYLHLKLAQLFGTFFLSWYSPSRTLTGSCLAIDHPECVKFLCVLFQIHVACRNTGSNFQYFQATTSGL